MIKAKNFFFVLLVVFVALFVVKGVRKEFGYKRAHGNIDLRLVKEEKPIVVIIPSYNNEEYVEKNLWSVLEQEYGNYRVIFIDDCSSDDTFNKARLCVESFRLEDKVTFVRNPANYKALYNLYYTIQSLPDDNIVVVLDGDDWLAHPRVLKEINRYYNDPNIWMAYGQYITYPKYEKGKTVLLNAKKRNLRGQAVFPQVRTFYAGLFKKIQLKDLLYKGKFFTTSWDLAIMFPLWEMAREHTVFIPDVLYVYNRETPLNDDKLHKEKQYIYNRYIRALPPYSALEHFQTASIKETSSALFIFSENRPLQLLSFLESLEKEGEGFFPIHVFYTSSQEMYQKGYDIVKERFNESVTFHQWKGKESFLHFVNAIESDYITLAKDTLVVNRFIKTAEAIRLLEKTGAYAAYFDLGLNIEEIPSNVLCVEEGFFVWDFDQGEKEWRFCNRLDMTLYRKKTLMPFLTKIQFSTLSEFEKSWKKGVDLRQIGLFCKESKVMNIPFQITKLDTNEKTLLYTEKELNDRLLEGYKIDISPIEELENHTTQVEFYPQFIAK